MQIYSGNHNKVAKSDSAYISDFHKGMKKIVARNIKRVVRQEGRRECDNFDSEVYQTEEEKMFFQNEDYDSFVSESNMESYRDDLYGRTNYDDSMGDDYTDYHEDYDYDSMSDDLDWIYRD